MIGLQGIATIDVGTYFDWSLAWYKTHTTSFGLLITAVTTATAAATTTTATSIGGIGSSRGRLLQMTEPFHHTSTAYFSRSDE